MLGEWVSLMLTLTLARAPFANGFSGTGRSRMLHMSIDSRRTVVVTGLGVISGCGNDVSSFWDNVAQGRCSIDRVTRFDVSDFPCQIASEVKDFTASDHFNLAKTARTHDAYTHYAVAAAKMAVRDAGLDMETVDKSRVGVIVGSAFGGMATYERETLKLSKGCPRDVSVYTIPALLGNTAAGVIGIEIGAKGPNFGVVSACATATHSIGEALRKIRAGEADVMIAGGTEAAITPLSFAGFSQLRAMSTAYNDNPTKSSRPFDTNRSGFIMGEGAGIIVLESLDHALKRGARVYCEIAGYGASGDAHHITSPDPEGKGLKSALEFALLDAKLEKHEVDYINAHGTSTKLNDKYETAAIKNVFGEELARKLHISSTKGCTGHALGAAGGLEAIVCAKTIETGVVAPTINYETPDPDCDLDYTANTAKKLDKVRVCVSDNLGFGGHNGVIVFERID